LKAERADAGIDAAPAAARAASKIFFIANLGEAGLSTQTPLHPPYASARASAGSPDYMFARGR
jgi:hypothetical protein